MGSERRQRTQRRRRIAFRMFWSPDGRVSLTGPGMGKQWNGSVDQRTKNSDFGPVQVTEKRRRRTSFAFLRFYTCANSTFGYLFDHDRRSNRPKGSNGYNNTLLGSCSFAAQADMLLCLAGQPFDFSIRACFGLEQNINTQLSALTFA